MNLSMMAQDRLEVSVCSCYLVLYHSTEYIMCFAVQNVDYSFEIAQHTKLMTRDLVTALRWSSLFNHA